MAGKKVIVEVDGTGKLHVEYEGFIGNTCFEEANQLKHYLAVYGVDADVIKTIDKKDEVETRRLENSASVGSGG